MTSVVSRSTTIYQYQISVALAVILALRAVPNELREGSLALGATRIETTFRVMLQASLSGIIASIILALSRAVGETMAVLMATGHALNNPFDTTPPFFHALIEVKTLTATIASEMGEVERGGDHWQVLFLIGVLLFTITFIVNLTAHFVVHGVKSK